MNTHIDKLVNFDFSKPGLYFMGDITIAIEDKASYGDKHAEYELFADSTGGALATVFNSETKKIAIDVLLAQPLYKAHAHALTDKTVILNTSVLEGLSHIEMVAILYHEIGHLSHDHLVGFEEIGIHVDLEKEKQADAFAASYVGKETMASAIKKITINIVKRLALKKQVTPKEASLLVDPNIIDLIYKRYAALTE